MTNVIALSSRAGETGINLGMDEMFQDLGASAGPVLVASFLATFTRTARLPSPLSPTGWVAVTVPAAAAFTWIFVTGAAIAALLGVLGFFLRNYRVAGGAAVTGPEPAAPSTRLEVAVRPND
jgi:fucose permease